jgi:hypothetical protein
MKLERAVEEFGSRGRPSPQRLKPDLFLIIYDGLKPVPFKNQDLSARREAVPFLRRVFGSLLGLKPQSAKGPLGLNGWTE